MQGPRDGGGMEASGSLAVRFTNTDRFTQKQKMVELSYGKARFRKMLMEEK